MGWGGVPTGAGLVDGGVDQGPWLQERVGGGVGASKFPKRSRGQGRVGLAVGGGCKGFGCGGVGGRGTGPRDGANFAVCRIFVVSNAYKKEEKCFFLKDALWGGQGRVGLAGKGWVGTHQSWLGGRGVKGSARGARASVLGEVVETRAPGTEQISQRMSYFCRF